jgi:ABC-type glycerol-3-phosphate transport system substrate-binding protein
MTTALHRLWLAAAAFSVTATTAFAQAPEGRLTVITSFAKEVTEPYVQAFQKKYPGTKVEMQNRNTAAAVTFIRETRSSPPDVMWASAPDAFEVLKKDKLLQKYQPKAQGIAAKVGSYPVNDPDGFFAGFAASGYGIMYNTRYLRANNIPAPKEWDDLKKPVYFVALRHHPPHRRDDPAGRGLGQRLGDPARDWRQLGPGVGPFVRRA